MKRIVGLILAVALAFGLAVPAFAAEAPHGGKSFDAAGTAAIGSGNGTQPVVGATTQAGAQNARPQAAQPKSLATNQYPSMAKEMARILNIERKKRNLPLFTWQTTSHVGAAETRAQELASKFDIVRPNGKEWTTAAPKAAYELGAKSEAYPSLSHFFDVWMDSPLLYQQVLDKEYKSVAIGYYEKSDVKYCVIHFYKEAGTALYADGWNSTGGKYCYVSGGSALTGWQTVNSGNYYFNTDTIDDYTGVATPYALTGWQEIGEKTFYFQKNGGAGAMGKQFLGWKKVNGRTFYFRKNGTLGKRGELFTGFQFIGGYKYYFEPDGKDGSRGKLVTGWKKIKNYQYYFQTNGKNGQRGRMFTGTKTIDGKTYVFNKSGQLIG